MTLSSCEGDDDGEAYEECAFEGMGWAVPEYTIQQVNKAGRTLIAGIRAPIDSEQGWADFDEALMIVNNWRISHSYPLNTLQMNLRKTSGKFSNAPLVAQRIKRLVSIASKLERQPKMKLSQMQDIGGCRAVLDSVSEVRECVNYYVKKSRIKHNRASLDDYITTPKYTGYRGVHIVYRYFSDRNKAFNDLKVEMQLRSQFQHAWATAVETVGTFVGQALKSNVGDEEWKRFFSLMGSAIAMREQAPPVPGTPTDRRELTKELAKYAETLNVQNRLRAYGNALRAIKKRAEKAHYYLLELDPVNNALIVTGFKMAEMREAEEKYEKAELVVRDNPGRDAVLVSVDSVNALERAYPNYFADTRVFVQLLDQELSGLERGISVPPLNIETG